MNGEVDRRGWTLVEHVVDDGYSGAVGSRPGLDRIMELAESGKIDAVLTKKRNRFFRSRSHRLLYEKSLADLGVRLIAVDDTGNRFADAMNDEFAGWYREEVAKNAQAGRLQKAREGKLVASQPRLRVPVHRRPRRLRGGPAEDGRGGADELIQKVHEDYEAQKQRLMRPGMDASVWYWRLGYWRLLQAGGKG